MNCGRLHELRNRSDSKIGSKKNLRIRAGWCKRQVRRAYRIISPINTSGILIVASRVCIASPKTQRNKRKCNELCKLSVTVTGSGETKNLRISTQVGVIRVINNDVDSTYQYLWDHHSINLTRWPASRQSQQRFANCNERFVLSLYRRISPVQVTFARHGGARGLNRRSFSVKLA